MNCICGCGRQLGRSEFDLNLLASKVALELMAWDRARALGSSVAAEEIATQIAAGAPRYQELIAVIHGEVEAGEAAEAAAEEWLRESGAERKQVSAQQPAVPKRKIRFSDAEAARLDRSHPERSFSGNAAAAATPVGGGERVTSLADPPTALELELGSVLASAREGGEDFERLAVGWFARLAAAGSPTLDELRWLLGRLEDARSGRLEEAETALRRFLAEEG